MTVCKSFKPSVNTGCKVLILGSMPGVKSLEMQEYYAHTMNRFWKLMGTLCDVSDLAGLSYENKLKTLLYHGFALWDVVKQCKRNGSLDSDITDEKPITARQCIKALAQVGVAKPQYIPRILSCLQGADLSKYKDSMRPLIEKDIAETEKILKTL